MTDVYGTHKDVVIEPSRDDLTKIKGIGTTTAEKLYNAKILTVQQIAEMTPERLSETPGIGLATAIKFIAAAKDRLEGFQKKNIRETTHVQEKEKEESIQDFNEKFEVAEVIVGEILDEETSYPTISERVEKVYDIIEEDVEEEANDIDFDAQPEKEQVNEYKEEFSQEVVPETPINWEQPKQKSVIEKESVESTIAELNSVNFEYSRDSTFESIVQQQINKVFKDAGCYEIPDSLELLSQFTTPLDYLGCKIVKTSDDVKILLLFPVKRFDREGTVLVNETRLEINSNKNGRGVYYDIEQIAKNLLQVRDSMYEDVANARNILEFFQKYLQITLSLERGFGRKGFVFLSGTTQYKVYIEPILLCYNPPRSMEKSLVFPYQRSSNLHAVSRPDVAPLVRFLEKKYRMIEKRTKKTSSVKDYRRAEETFRTSVRYASIPIFGYSVALLVIYFAKLYFLLRLFNTIGFAVLGIYISLLAFFYFRAYKTKKEFTDQFETPYYQQNLEYSETDLLDFKEELTDELITQFGYECLEKNANSGVIEQSETNALKQTVEIKRAEPEFKKMFEPEQLKAETVTNSTTKYGIKYQDFLQDS